jgi:general secretion pathway protein I
MWRRATSISPRQGDGGAGDARPLGIRHPAFGTRRDRLGRGGARQPPRDPRGGFTLIEVMVALTIIATAFVGLLSLHNRNLAMVGRDGDLTRATLLARELITKMELIEQFPDTGTSRGEFEDSPGFYWEREVEDTDIPTVRRVQLRVIWDPRIADACELVYFIRDRRESQTP